MKFKKKRSGHNNASGVRSIVKGRKEQRKQKRLQKKQNRALYAARLQGKHHQRQNNSGGEKVESRPGKIKQLQALVEAEKMKMKSKFPNNQSPLKVKKNLTTPKSPIQSDETGGFKASVSNSDRLARLQEFVNREAGISQGKNSKADRADKDSGSNDSSYKGNLIKDKKKLKMLRKEQKDDTREINKLARLLGYRKPHQKKKVAPIFADDFGSLLEDIDAGTMVHGDSYKSDDRNAQDSEDDFEKDMAVALGQEPKKKGNLDKDAGMNGNLENERDSENVDEQFMQRDFDDFESGINSEDDEMSEDDVDESEGEEDDIDEEGSIGCDDMSEDDEQGSSAGNDPKYKRFRNDLDDDEEEEDIEEEEEENSFLDSQAEEDSTEESNDDGELVHDIRREVDYAFEGGSRYYSKPEILKNGQENDIDRYSSCSEDDEDLEDFIVDDNHVEYEDVSDELPDKLSDSLSPVKKKKKKKRIIVPSDNSEDDGHTENEKDVDDDIFLIPGGQNEERKRKELSDSLSPVKKKKKHVITSDNSEDDRYINNRKDDVDDICLLPKKKKEKRKRKNDLPKKIIVNISCDEGDYEDSDDASHVDSEADKTRKQENETCKIKKTKKNTKSSDKEDIENKKSVLKLKNNLPKKKAVVQIPSSSDEEACSIRKTKETSKKYSDVEDKENKKSRLKEKNNVPKMKAVVHVSAGKDDSEDSDNEHHIDDKGDRKRKQEKEACNKEKKQKTQSCNLKDVKKQISILKSEDKASPQRKKKARVSFDLPNANDSDELSDEEEENDESESEALSVEEEEEEVECVADGKELKEDIYGRLRDKDGNILNPSNREAVGTGRYVPPALRKLMALNTDERKKEQLANMKKSLKGLLNRLAESNLGGIVSQIEGMYLKHSRNDMNDIITNLLMESLVAPTLTPERLVQEHALLVAVLSANVGNEVGAHILNEFVLRWSDSMDSLPVGEEVETKELDNLLLFTANLYNFRVVEAHLIYDILNRLAQGFSSKEVELILLILRSVGFTLRKDNPLALKSLITKIQSQAAAAQSKDEEAEFSRVRFMLEVIQAIRNNNMAKVPNFDPAHSEHLKKIQKGLIRKGTQTSQLNVTLEDLLKSRECGRWWIVGSAWSGTLPGEKPPQENRYQNPATKNKALEAEFSEKFKAKAAKLQLSRPPRINILYIITEGSEDYLDAFEKLLQLSLPATQERDLFSVVLLCCQKSKVYNPFFAHLADRMCKFDKKYKRLLQFALWDKFQEIENIKPREVANLAKFLTHLIGENSLSLFILKHISFMEAESQMISFLRQILIGLLLHPAGSDTVHRVFSELSVSPKLVVLRQSLRIFILKFLSTKKNKENSEHQMLSKRIEEVTDILNKGRGISL